MLECALLLRPAAAIGLDGRAALVAAVTTAVMIGPLLPINYLMSGQFVLLTEVLTTGDVPLAQWFMSMVKLDCPWLLGGVVQGFWWSGYFSFVVRAYYYLPLLIPGAAVVLALRFPGRLWTAGRLACSHMLAVVFFVAGLAWHAGLTILSATLLGATSHGGNEGWYLDVLIGIVFTVLVVVLAQYLPGATLTRVLVVSALGLVAWNLLGRVMLLLFGSGQVAPGAALPAGLSGALGASFAALLWATGGTQVSLPGAIGPAWLTVLLPLGLSLAMTAYLCRELSSSMPATYCRQGRW